MRDQDMADIAGAAGDDDILELRGHATRLGMTLGTGRRTACLPARRPSPQLRAAGITGRFLKDDSGPGKEILPPEKPFG
jgi:hypothetical protein